MKIKIFVLVFLAVFVCGCTEAVSISLDGTAWSYGDYASVDFYGDNTGKIDVDGVEISFRYVVSDNQINITCSDELLAAEYGLDALPFFGTHTVAADEGNLVLGDWCLTPKK